MSGRQECLRCTTYQAGALQCRAKARSRRRSRSRYRHRHSLRGACHIVRRVRAGRSGAPAPARWRRTGACHLAAPGSRHDRRFPGEEQAAILPSQQASPATSRSTRGAPRALRQRGLAAARAAGPGSARIALGVEAHGAPLEEDTVRRATDLPAAAAGLAEPFTTMLIDRFRCLHRRPPARPCSRPHCP